MATRKPQPERQPRVDLEELESYHPSIYQPGFVDTTAEMRGDDPTTWTARSSARWTKEGVTRWLEDRAAFRRKGAPIPRLRSAEQVFFMRNGAEMPADLLAGEGITDIYWKDDR